MIRTSYNNVLEIIENRLIPDKTAKQLRGEVFTPLKLASEMLFGLRKSALKSMEKAMPDITSSEYYKLIWGLDEDGSIIEDDPEDRIGGIPLELFRNPNTKWLDPANGIGNFPFVAFYMIDYQLNHHSKDRTFKGEKNKNKRRKHIVENMLYMIEINKGNTNTARKIFNLLVPGAKTNIFCADTLTLSREDINRILGTDEFDVIMGNPPYNSGGVKSSGATNYQTIWDHFIFQTENTKKKKSFPGSIKLLKKGGYLCFIHPSSWLQKSDIHNEIMLRFNIQFIRIYTDEQNNNLFSGGGLVGTTYYVLENRQSTLEDNIIILETNNKLIKLSRRNYKESNFTIFRCDNIALNNIYTRFKTIDELVGIDGKKYYSTDGKLNDDLPPGTYKYISTHVKGGIVVCRTDKKFKHYGKPKIIFASSRYLYHYDDYAGEYGIFGNNIHYIIDTKENLKKISKFLDTKFVKYILKATKHSQELADFKYIPDIRDYTGIISDEALCREFGLDYESVRSQKDIPNNQNILKELPQCVTSKTKKAEKAKAEAETKKEKAKAKAETKKEKAKSKAETKKSKPKSKNTKTRKSK